jgi:histidinol phosphatase-like enzyme (inositol monophosphatase family)
MTSSLLLESAIALAKLTGDVALRHYQALLAGHDLGIETKADGSPVSRADRESELAAREYIARHPPSDGVLGEELGLSNPDARRRWCIDPIDGTKTFLAGCPLWGSLVAVVEGDEVLAGAAVFPATKQWIAAAPGLGVQLEGGRAGVSGVDDVAAALVLATDERFPDAPERVPAWTRLGAKARLSRTWGDCFGYWLVATGKAELMTDGTLSPWDAACFLPILEEAGGVVTDWEGRRTAFGKGLIATNRALAAPLRDLLGVPSGGTPP